MAVFTGLSALRDAGLSWPEDTRRHNVGAIVGTGTALADRHSAVPLAARNPKWFLETYPNLALGHLSRIAELPGYGSTIVAACTSGTHAVGTAFHMIQSGKADILLAGAVENKFYAPVFSGFRRLNMCTASDDPEKAMRPFDRNRSGFVIAKGACFLVLENRRVADRRGARPRCSVVGYGSSMNACSLTDANRDGIRRSMAGALQDAGLGPTMVDYINAHGTSTISNDREETAAIKELFEKHAYRIPVNSTKSMLGHSFAACGAIESAVCVSSLEDQKVHPTRNFVEGGNDCDLDYVKEGWREANIRYAMNNSSGVGGYNASVIFERLT
jgi:3-oxoacyl-[acyl-carrier-protein] synthase II